MAVALFIRDISVSVIVSVQRSAGRYEPSLAVKTLPVTKLLLVTPYVASTVVGRFVLLLPRHQREWPCYKSLACWNPMILERCHRIVRLLFIYWRRPVASRLRTASTTWGIQPLPKSTKRR